MHVLAIMGPRNRRGRPPWVPDSWGSAVAAFAAATVPSIVAIVLRWQGGDLPAQIFRADLVRRDGFRLWNHEWFGGHATLSYSVLSPVLGSLTGPIALGALSGIV